MSSAWLSVLAKISVFGISLRPGKISGSLSRKVRITVRIWSGFTTERSSSLAPYVWSSSWISQRLRRVRRSRFSTEPARIRPPCCVLSVSTTYTSLPTLTPSATACSWEYSLTTFFRKNP